ncbi:MAG: GTPase [Pseudomonadota bacterium]
MTFHAIRSTLYICSIHTSGNCQSFEITRATAKQGHLLQEGMTVVLAGAPNAGKSSLLNRLAGYDAAIVTDVPGTTRDTLKEYIHLDGMPLHIIDTAGLRDSDDLVEQEGMRRTQKAMSQADRVLWLVDSTDSGSKPVSDDKTTVILNKIDLSGLSSGLQDQQPDTICISVKTGEGMDDLVNHLKDLMGYDSGASGVLSARRRHLDALDHAFVHMTQGKHQLEQGAGELMAEELRLAQQVLGTITGVVTSDDLLGLIFSSFCIGK